METTTDENTPSTKWIYRASE